MNARRKANSTEDLLELIREDDSPVADRVTTREQSTESPVRSGGGQESSFNGSAATKKACGIKTNFSSRGLRKVLIGVDVREDCIDFARLSKGGVDEIKRVTLEPGVVPGTEAFADVLRSSLAALCGPKGKPPVWVVLRGGELDMTPLRLPKKGAGRHLSETVYWKLKQEKKFDETESIFDFHNEGTLTEGGIEKVEIMAAMAARADVETLAAAFVEAGCEPEGIVPMPSVLQNAYGCNMVPSEPGLTVSVHIDSSFSCISIFEGSRLHFTRIIKSGANSMGESLMMHLHSSGVRLGSIAEVRELLLDMLEGRPPEEGSPLADMDENHLFAVVSPALHRLSRQAERTIQYYNTQNETHCDRVHFSGEPFVSPRIAEFMGGQLGLPYEVLGFTQGVTVPRGASAMSFTPAILAALSREERTLNLLNNYRERAFRKTWKRINFGAGVAALLVLLGIVGAFGWMKLNVMEVEAAVADAKARYNSINPKISRSMLEDMAAKLIRGYDRIDGVDRRYEPLAALAELTRLTPKDVKLLGVNMESPSAAPQGDGQKAATPPGVLVVDAVVLNSPAGYEAGLSSFLVGLEDSPIFGLPVVHSATLREMVPEGQVYHVVLHLGMKG
ncbi:hypothetical protein [Salidesulfovibrio brasiliensis]